ncbi:MAG: sigma-54-dependent Fis family transcriptional regulator [Myxococcales bacterium]|nr:sigma-54-dependent Fis family transcriptional regulator [Myxococcales bacterium]
MLDRIVGASPAIDAVRRDIVQYAISSAPVVIHGESGVGKELVAHALHACSTHASRRFIAANVGAFCPELLGSELFGHGRGAFTGAVSSHRGLFEQAHEGTLFLDEIGELAPSAQTALLRVLESGEMRPLGTEITKHVRVRLVAATHRDLAAMVRDGHFRRDLYYRLHVLTIRVPALRERKRDIPELAAAILDRLHDEVGVRSLSSAALRVLAAYRWPGNVRQLVSVLRRACAQSSARTIDEDEVAIALMGEGQTECLPRGKSRLDATTVGAAMRASDGKIAKAARALGVPRSTLRDCLERLRDPKRSGGVTREPLGAEPSEHPSPSRSFPASSRGASDE